MTSSLPVSAKITCDAVILGDGDRQNRIRHEHFCSTLSAFVAFRKLFQKIFCRLMLVWELIFNLHVGGIWIGKKYKKSWVIDQFYFYSLKVKIHVTSFSSILYCKNSEYWPQTHAQSGNINSIILDVYVERLTNHLVYILNSGDYYFNLIRFFGILLVTYPLQIVKMTKKRWLNSC